MLSSRLPSRCGHHRPTGPATDVQPSHRLSTDHAAFHRPLSRRPPSFNSRRSWLRTPCGADCGNPSLHPSRKTRQRRRVPEPPDGKLSRSQQLPTACRRQEILTESVGPSHSLSLSFSLPLSTAACQASSTRPPSDAPRCGIHAGRCVPVKILPPTVTAGHHRQPECPCGVHRSRLSARDHPPVLHLMHALLPARRE